MNLARFIVEGSVSGVSHSDDGGFDAVHGETLSFRLEEGPSSRVQTVTYRVRNVMGKGPRATKGAPVLNLVGSTTGQTVNAATPDAAVKTDMPSEGVHAWVALCLINGGKDNNGHDNPNYVFERLIVLRSGLGVRKIVAAEGTQYEPDGWAHAINEMIDAVSVPVKTITGTYALKREDLGKQLKSTGSSDTTVVVPAQDDVSWPKDSRVSLLQAGTGKLIVTGAPGVVTVEPEPGHEPWLRGRIAHAILQKDDTDHWFLYGGLELQS